MTSPGQLFEEVTGEEGLPETVAADAFIEENVSDAGPEATGAAAILLGLVFGVGELTRFIGDHLPNLSVLGVGIHIGDWFAGLGGDVASDIVGATEGVWGAVTGLFSTHAYVTDNMGRATVNAIHHHGDQIQFLAGSHNASVLRAIGAQIAGVENAVFGAIGRDVRMLEGQIRSARGAAGTDASRARAQAIHASENYARAASRGERIAAEKYALEQSEKVHREVAIEIHNTRRQVLGRAVPLEKNIGDAGTALGKDLEHELQSLRGRVKALEGCVVYDCPPGSHGLNPKNNLQNALRGDSGIVQDVVMAAFVAEAIGNPKHLAEGFADIAGGVYHGADGLLDTLLHL